MSRARYAAWPFVTLAYVAITIAMTWPLTGHLASRIAWDLGDPVFNAWVMAWTGGQVLALFRGQWDALHDYWNGNIFYPEKLTIAYSEHLTPQMLQSLPVYALSGNIVLGYNLVFLSTFVLCGLGTYLLVRDLTGRPLAAFFAGLAFAFAPYRIAQSAHIQVMSAYWMPLAFFGLRRYFESRRTRPLAGASAAIALQNLSCGYYLLFFSPFAAAYCVYELARRRLLRSWRMWASLALAGLFVAAITWPFVAPYFRLRHFGDVGVRSYEEIIQFSADVYSFATAGAESWLWGDDGAKLRAFPKGEGEGFAGFTILACAAIGVVVIARDRLRRQAGELAFYAGAAIAAAILALGPRITLGGKVLTAGPYALLYRWVPGFDGLRVPARYLMLVAFFAAVLAGLGAAAIIRRNRRAGAWVVGAACVGVLAEGAVRPFPASVRLALHGYEATPRSLSTGDEMSPLYKIIHDAPPQAVLIEFPFGEMAYEIRATFFAGYHRHKLVNGYSGFFPEAYLRRATFLRYIPPDLEAATKALYSSGATHALVHEAAYLDDRGHEISDWIASTGGEQIAVSGTDKLFRLRR